MSPGWTDGGAPQGTEKQKRTLCKKVMRGSRTRKQRLEITRISTGTGQAGGSVWKGSLGGSGKGPPPEPSASVPQRGRHWAAHLFSTGPCSAPSNGLRGMDEKSVESLCLLSLPFPQC